MEGVTAAIVAFIFVGMVLPNIIKIRSHFYIGLTAVLAIIFFDAMLHMFGSPEPDKISGLGKLCYFLIALLQILAIVMLVWSSGGPDPRELGGEISNAIEVVRRGETDSEVVVPLPKSMQNPLGGSGESDAGGPGSEHHRQPRPERHSPPGGPLPLD